MQRFKECCPDPEVEEQDSFSEPMFCCTNCGTHHATPPKETAEYIELQAKYKDTQEAYIKLWVDTENGDIQDTFFKHRERFRKLIQGES